MTFLPIAQRELRVAARQKATHRWRMFFGIGGIVLAGGIGLVALATRGFFGGQAGIWIFAALKWIAFVVACASGVFLTSDCVSGEKREGTLGLLFLTDLRGYDVAAGKLLATSLRPFYSLLAIFPVMALSFVLGGVPSGEFGRSVAAICNTLFFSLALGLAVSVVSRDANRAMTATGLIMVGVLNLPTMLSSAFPAAWHFRVELLSPLFAFEEAGSYRASGFWESAAITHFLGWGLLALASWLTPRTWQQKRLRAPLRMDSAWLRWLTFNRAAKLRTTDPVAWIIARDRWAATFATIALTLSSLLLVFSLLAPHPQMAAAAPPAMPTVTASSNSTVTTNGSVTTFSYNANVNAFASATVMTPAYYIASTCVSLVSFLLELWLVAQVSRFYVEGKKSGFLELLLVTPTTPKEIVRSHWRALRQIFLAPVAAQLALTLVMGGLGMAANPALGASMSMGWQAAVLLLSAAAWATGMMALAWYALWMGLKTNTIAVAAFKAFCYVKVLPNIALGFVMGISVFFLVTSLGMTAPWLIIVLPAGVAILINIGLAAFARVEIPDAFKDLREAGTR